MSTVEEIIILENFLRVLAARRAAVDDPATVAAIELQRNRHDEECRALIARLDPLEEALLECMRLQYKALNFG